MELEQRIKTLEYEMKILKNEVQRTLLDIQEQVLVHYYPALRADETKPSEGTIQAIQALRSRPGSQSTGPAALPAPAAEAVGAPREPAAPLLKKVSLEEIRTAQNELTAAAVPAEAGSNGKGGGNGTTDPSNLKLLEWLMSNAAKGGDAHDEKQANQMLDELTKLKALVGDASNMEEALKRIEGAKLG